MKHYYLIIAIAINCNIALAQSNSDLNAFSTALQSQTTALQTKIQNVNYIVKGMVASNSLGSDYMAVSSASEITSTFNSAADSVLTMSFVASDMIDQTDKAQVIKYLNVLCKKAKQLGNLAIDTTTKLNQNIKSNQLIIEVKGLRSDISGTMKTLETCK